MCRNAGRAQLKAPVRFRSITADHSSSDILDDRIDETIRFLCLADVGLDDSHTPAYLAKLVGDRFSLLSALAMVDCYIRADRRQCTGDFGANPA
jgi:hypothetical protein